jgi:hypothetical protein
MDVEWGSSWGATGMIYKLQTVVSLNPGTIAGKMQMSCQKPFILSQSSGLLILGSLAANFELATLVFARCFQRPMKR